MYRLVVCFVGLRQQHTDDIQRRAEANLVQLICDSYTVSIVEGHALSRLKSFFGYKLDIAYLIHFPKYEHSYSIYLEYRTDYNCCILKWKKDVLSSLQGPKPDVCQGKSHLRCPRSAKVEPFQPNGVEMIKGRLWSPNFLLHFYSWCIFFVCFVSTYLCWFFMFALLIFSVYHFCILFIINNFTVSIIHCLHAMYV